MIIRFNPAEYGWEIPSEPVKRTTVKMLGGLMALQSLVLAGGLASDNDPAVASEQVAAPTVMAASETNMQPPDAAKAKSLPPEVIEPACLRSSIAWLPETVARWHPYVAATAEKFSLPPPILDILMTFESLGHPNIVSKAGAVGLVQIMPTTAPGLEAQLGTEPLDLNDPASNIFLSGRYIRNVLDSGEVDLSQGFTAQVSKEVAIAYNGGMGSLQKYHNTGRIPYAETQSYADRVSLAWTEQNQPVSQALNEYMTHKGPQQLVAAAGSQGTAPC